MHLNFNFTALYSAMFNTLHWKLITFLMDWAEQSEFEAKTETSICIYSYWTLIAVVSTYKHRFSFGSLICLECQAKRFNVSGNMTGTYTQDYMMLVPHGIAPSIQATTHRKVTNHNRREAPVHIQEWLTCRYFSKEGAQCQSPTTAPSSEQTSSFVLKK